MEKYLQFPLNRSYENNVIKKKENENCKSLPDLPLPIGKLVNYKKIIQQKSARFQTISLISKQIFAVFLVKNAWCFHKQTIICFIAM